MASKLRLYSEYYGACFGLWLIRFLPPRFSCGVAHFVGSLAYFCIPSRRRTAVGNLLKTGVAKDLASARKIAKASFQSIALAVTESLVVPRLYDDGKLPADAIELVIPEETRALLNDKSKGVITVSAHLGNWELGAKISSTFKPISAIARKMNNSLVQGLMEKAKIRDGFETIDKHVTNPMIFVRVLKKHNCLALLTDQHAHDSGEVIIDFFGHKAATYSTPAVLSHLTGAPILLCVAIRTGLLRFRIEYSKPIYYKIEKTTYDDDVIAATQDIASRLEVKIRESPEQYLWAHRRWRVN